MKLLLSAPGIDVNKANKRGETPLSMAINNGHKECAKLLIAAGATESKNKDGCIGGVMGAILGAGIGAGIGALCDNIGLGLMIGGVIGGKLATGGHW